MLSLLEPGARIFAAGFQGRQVGKRLAEPGDFKCGRHAAFDCIAVRL
jgi:hypothetical protein